MCGIAGKLWFDPDGTVDVREVERMCGTIRHRGPDDDGFYVDGPLGMGMRRLSIIDLSTGKQPIHNEDETVWVVYNGEIYNFPELRPALEAKGHRFYTRTDTEVIVHLYEEYGEDFVTHLTGMFAIALWDRPRRKLVLVRDRLGIKPLYYAAGTDRLLFGSELKTILEDGIDRSIDLQALHDYLSLSWVPGPRSIFRAAQKLPPGHLLVARGSNVAVRPYWQIPYPEHVRPRTVEAASEELDALLQTVVRDHLLSDVPLGVFLSGGVDSGGLVALAAESGPVETFSIGFEEKSYDELAVARLVAERYGTRHHEMTVRADAVSLVPELVHYFDEPFADSSAIPVYCVAKLARQHVKVALSGEGGDEVFAGYETYGAWRYAELYKRLPRLLSESWLPAAIRKLPVSHGRVPFDYKAKRFVDSALLPPEEGHFGWKVIFTEDAKAALYAAGPNGFEHPARLYRQAFESCTATETLTRLQHIDLLNYLPDDILVKADRMSMANSLEARVPYLDHRVVEFAAALPASLKLRGLKRKFLLKHTLSRRLPKAVWAGKKRGFNVPIPAWIAGPLRDFTHDVLGARRFRDAGFFKPEGIDRLLREHERKENDWSRNIWSLAIFALWHEAYASKGPASGEQCLTPNEGERRQTSPSPINPVSGRRLTPID